MHARAVVAEQRLRHERDRLAVLPRGVLDDVFVELHVVGGVQQGVEFVVDLGLAAAAHLVVRLLQHEPGVDQVGGHLVAQVDVLVVGRHREVPALVAHLVPAVRGAVGLGELPGVPPARDRVDLVERAVGFGVERHRVEDVELGLRTEERGVGDAGALQVVLRLAGDVARVARVRLEGERVVHEEVDVQRLGGAERVDLRGVRVGQQHHVGLVNGLEPTDRRTVERDTVVEVRLVERRRWNGEVLDDAGQIAEPDVDVLDLLVGNQFDDVVGGCFGHCRRSPSRYQTRGLTLGSRCCTPVNRMLHRRYAMGSPVKVPDRRFARLSWGAWVTMSNIRAAARSAI